VSAAACGTPEPRLHFVDEGAGTPVVVLHGFTGSGASMAGVAEALRGRHRVIRVDLVGHGASPAPRETAPYTMERCAAQLAGLAEALGLGPAHWLGYSMGGRAALALAAWRPHCVRSLLLVGASAGIADPTARAARVRADEVLAARIERDGVAAFVAHWMALPLFASQARLGSAALEAARRQRLANRPHGLANSLRGMGAGAQPPLHALLPGLRAPACLVSGAQDAKFTALAQELATLLPRGRAVSLPGAGHAAHLEAPDAFASLALDFFAEVERGAEAARPHGGGAP
jgi:2-succinyl-6-hydroxy-2,4-cyclohexadiene-1-carboxylate synthase